MVEPSRVSPDHLCTDFPPPSQRRHQCGKCGTLWRLSSRTIGGVVYPQWLRVESGQEAKRSA